MLEQHIAHPLRPDGPELFGDSVGIGCYRIDLHPRVSGAGYLDLGCWPFQIPLGAMIPVRVENLLPGGKNLGVTHITNGAFRVHPGRMERGRGRRTPGGVLPRTKAHAEIRPESSGASRSISGAAAARGHRALLAEAPTCVRDAGQIGGFQWVPRPKRQGGARTPRDRELRSGEGGDTCVCARS